MDKPETAKLFMNGRSQAVRLPSEFRFQGKEVFIRRDQATGDVVYEPLNSGGASSSTETISAGFNYSF